MAYKIYKPKDLLIEKYYLIIDRLNIKIKEIKDKLKKSEEIYNKLVLNKVNFFKKINECNTNKECKLHNIATFLIKQKPYLKKHIKARNKIVIKSTNTVKIRSRY